MKPASDNPADPFKKALAEATKVMADDPELTVSYSVDPPGLTGDQVRLPQVTRRMTRDEVLLARGTADALALRHRYHDARTFARYQPAGPDGARALRRDGRGAVRGRGRARDAGHRRQHRRQDRRRGRAPGLCPDPRACRCAACDRGGLSDPAPGDRADPAPGCGERHGLWRGFIEDSGGRHAGRGVLETRRPGGLRALRPAGDHRSGLWRPTWRRSRCWRG
jgi:cobaltochelatase CobT